MKFPTACLLLPFICVLGSGCQKSPGFEPLPNGVRFTPPSSYAGWWQQMEGCSGLSGDLSTITWFKVSGQSFFNNGQLVYAVWSLQYNAITLASAHIDDSLIVRHEMLHDLLGVHGHPTEYFVTKCGSLLGDFVD